MSKTPYKVLLTAVLTFCLLIAQAAFLGSPSTANASHANLNSGNAIFLSQSSSSQGTQATLSVTGTGFKASEAVTVTFNAANPTGLGVHSPDPRTATNTPIVFPPFPLAAPLNGDNDETFSPTAVPVQPNNSLSYTVTTDGNGNFTSPAGIQFVIPANAVAGSYRVEADGADATSGRTAAATGVVGFFQTGDFATATYTITPPAAPQLSVLSSLSTTNVVQLGGIFTVVAAPQTFQSPNIGPPVVVGDTVQFLLESFAASTPPGFVPPTAIEPAGVTYKDIPGAAGPGGATFVPLRILACSNGAVVAGGALSPQGCLTDRNGGVSATLQLTDARGAGGVSILSSTFFDQQYAVVAVNTVGTKAVSGGVKIDASQSIISLSSNRVALGGSVNVRGFGFGANTTVQLFFGGQPASKTTCTFYYNNGAPTVPSSGVAGAPAYNSAVFPLGAPPAGAPTTPSPCLVGMVTTDASGSFNTSVSVPGVATTATTASILAEDFGQATETIPPSVVPTIPPEANMRLNEGAVQGLSISTVSISGLFGVSPSTAAVGQTVTYSGTGYTPFEVVTVTLVDTTGTGCKAATQATTQANGIGAVAGTFVVPAIRDCTVEPATGFPINTGAKVTVTATGGQSHLANSATLTIPATKATISLPTASTISLTGTGFASGEPVTFQFGLADPFTGLPTNALSISTNADVSGSVAATTALPTGFGSGLYTVTARGLNSLFSATATNQLSNNGFLQGGVVPCLIGPELAGQSFNVTGTSFAQSSSTNLFSNGIGNGTLSVNFSPTPVATTPITVDASGAFTSTVTVPLGTVPGTYTITVSAFVPGVPFAVQRTCSVTVVAGTLGLLINPTSGPIGSTVAISSTGFAPGEPVTASLQFPAGSALAGTDVPGTQQTFTADATGAISATFTVKSSVGLLIAGSYNLTVKGGNTGLTKSAAFVVTSGIGASTASVFFAEGFTGTTAGGANANFTETLSILNANNFTTTYTVTYFIENPGAASTQKAVGGSIGPNSVVQRSVNTDVGLNAEVAAEVSSPAPLASTRIIARTNAAGAALDSSSSLGQQLDLTAAAPTGGFNYYLATGEIQLTNEEYLTLLNPTSTAASVTINILPQTVVSSTTVTTVAPITASVPANSRVTVPIRKNLIGKGVVQFGVAVNSNVQIAVERPEYYGDGIGSAKYGATTKPAATSAANQFIFAADSGVFPSTGGNAAVGTGNDLSEIDIINPGTVAAGSATVTVSFFDKSGNPINSQQVQVDGGTRETVEVNDVVSTQADVFSTVVTSDKNIFVERPTYYGGDPSKGGTFAVNNPAGASAGLESVAFPFLDTATSTSAVISQTVYLYNPGATTISVRGIYASAGQTVVKTYSVAKNSILAVNVNADAATLPKTALGGIFQVVQTGSGTSDAFVASVVSNTPDFKNAVGNQGTYPIAAATGQ